jgi:hypothetical protein
MPLVVATDQDRAWALTSAKARKLMRQSDWNAVVRSAFSDALWWWVGNYLPLRFEIGYARGLGYSYKRNSPFFSTGESAREIVKRIAVEVRSSKGKAHGVLHFPWTNMAYPNMAPGRDVFRKLPAHEIAAITRTFRGQVLDEIRQASKVRVRRGATAGQLRLKFGAAQRTRIGAAKNAYRSGRRRGMDIYSDARLATLEKATRRRLRPVG